MKKITFLLIHTIFVILTLSSSASAQKGKIAFHSPAALYSFLSPFEKMGFEKIKANNVNIKAVRDFVQTFKNIDNNKWFAAQDGGFTSTFDADGIKTTVAYNSRGARQYIIKIYDEDKLSYDIRHMVKREYYDAVITLVKEVETDKGLVFYIHMQDKYTWKIVSVTDNEMQLVENLNKS